MEAWLSAAALESPSPGPSQPCLRASLAWVPCLVVGEPAWRSPRKRAKGGKGSQRAGSASFHHTASLHRCMPRRRNKKQMDLESSQDRALGLHPQPRETLMAGSTDGRQVEWPITNRLTVAPMPLGQGARVVHLVCRCKFGWRPHPHPHPPPSPAQTPLSSNL